MIFLETGYHFAVLLEYRGRVARDWKLNFINALPSITAAQHEAQFGLLHFINPTSCCQLRKVEPLMRSLEPYTWWFTGLRREQSPTRSNLRKIEDHRLPSGKRMKKISVLAEWTWDQVEACANEHDIPRLSLYDEGYASIGCEPARRAPLPEQIIAAGDGAAESLSAASIPSAKGRKRRVIHARAAVHRRTVAARTGNCARHARPR